MKKNLLFPILLIYSFFYSQNIPTCMTEDVNHHTFMSCGFHTTILKTATGFQVFGAYTNYLGTGHLYTPTDITPVNDFNYQGEILSATLGDYNVANPRMFILTTYGLYTWGRLNTTLLSSTISTTRFQQMSLPDGIRPEDIKKMEASYAGLVLLTNSGNVYVIGRKSQLFGDGSSNMNIWHKVPGISNVKLISTADCVIFAYTASGEYYTWGEHSYLGNGTTVQTRLTPTKMTAPFSGEPKMIVVGTQGTYLALGPDKKIYALGYNNVGQLGIGNRINATSWTNVLPHSGSAPGYLEDVVFINTTNNHSATSYSGASSAITSNGTMYLWGSNDASMISNAAANQQTLPIIPSGFTPGSNNAVYVENGGHITPYVDSALKKYGYVGHLTQGSMGNGTSSGYVGEYDLVNTPTIEFCFMAELETRINCKDVDFILDISESVSKIEWDFGDGSPVETTSNITSKQHSYANPGEYTVTITITHGNNQTKIITQKVTISIPLVDLGTDKAICEGGFLFLDAGNKGSTYLWSTGETTQSIRVDKAGNYSVAVTDANGCVGTDDINISINPLPLVDLGPDQAFCQGETALLDAGNPGSTYLWSTGETTQTITVNHAGRYSVTVTDANGCSNTDEINITVHPLPLVDIAYKPKTGARIGSTGNEDDTFSTKSTDPSEPTDTPIPCQGTEMILDAGYPGSTYLWSTGETTQTITVTEGGKYSVTITTQYGCTSTGEVDIKFNPLPVIDLGPDQSICEGTTVTLDAENPGSSYLWSTGETTQTITVNKTGTYSVTVIDANGCVGYDEINITVNPLPVVDLGTDHAICRGSSTILDAGSHPAGSTFLWNTGETTQTITVNTAGKYSVTVTDANGCEGYDEINITVNPLPVVDLGTDHAICQGSSTILDAGSHPAGSTFLWNTGETTQTITVTTAGKYYVTVTDTNGCEGYDEINITVNPLPLVDLGPDQKFCQGSSTILDAGSHPAGSTFLWNTGETTQTITVTTTGKYSVTVTDANGCEGYDEINITVNPLPIVDLGTDHAICQGSSTILDAGSHPAGSTFLWNTGETTQTITVTTAGKYSVTVTDANGCEGYDEINITVNPLPIVDLGGNQTVCYGTTVTLDAGNAGATYLWSTGETTQTIDVTNKQGTYTVTVTDTNGCVNEDTMVLTVNPLPIVNLGGDQSVCEGTTLTLDAGNPGSSYLWSIGETTQTIQVNTSGTYTVTVTDANGCSNEDTMVLTVNPLPIVDLGGDQTVCYGIPVILDAGNTGASYLWSTGETTQTIDVTNKQGTYTVTVTDANGCVNEDTMVLTVNPLPVVDLGPDQTVCYGTTVTLDAGNAGATYLWSTGEATQTIDVTNKQGTYTVTVTDANGCSNEDTMVLTVNPLPIVDLGGDQTVCYGTPVILDAGNTGASYLWSTGETTQTIDVTNKQGTYTVTVTDVNGCVNEDTMVLTVNPLPVVDLGPDQTVCYGTTVTLDAGNAGATYLWSTGETTQTIDVTNKQGTYMVTVTDANGCSNEDTMVLTVNPLPIVDLGGDQTVCYGTPVLLDAGNTGATYLWSTGETTQTIDVTNKQGTYTVTVTDANGCVNEDTMVLTVNPLPVVDLGPDQTVCYGTTVTLDAGNAGATYLWSTGETTQTIDVTNKQGTYTVTVTDANGCVNEDTMVLTVNPLPVVDLGPDQFLCEGSSTILDAGNAGATYLWSTGETTQTITVNTSGIYSVTVTDVNGCSNTDEINITVNPLPVVDLGPDQTVCYGTTVTLDAGNTGATYLWSTGETTQTIDITNKQGTYTVTVTDANGCVNEDTMVLTINPLPIVDLGPDQTVCYGTTVTLDAGNPGSNYLWSTGETTQTIQVNTSGTYTVTVTDANGCSNEDTMVLTVNPLPIVDLGGNQTVCHDTPVILNAGNPGSSYLWSTGETTQTIDVTNKQGTYTVTVTDTNGCVNEDTMVLTINPLPVVDIGPDQTVCYGTTVTLDAGNAGATYLWSNGETTQTIDITNKPGTYTVTVTDANGCSNEDTMVLTVNPLPIVDLGGDQTVCYGTYVILNAGNPGSSYLWSNGATTQTIDITNKPGIYKVIVTNANGCVSEDSMVLTVNPLPIVDLGPDQSVCEGTPVTLDAGNPGATYLWSNGETTQTIQVTETGTYSVRVTNSYGCSVEDKVMITVHPLPEINLGGSLAVCQGDFALLDAGNPGSTYLWSTGETTQTIKVYTSGEYYVTVTSPYHCVNSDKVLVTVNPKPIVTLDEDIITCETSVQINAEIESTDAYSSYWTTPSGAIIKDNLNPVAYESGTYTLTTITDKGCVVIKRMKVLLASQPEVIEVKVDRQSAQVTASGDRPLEYSIDRENWQSSPNFNNLEYGVYNVYVRSKYGCISEPYPFGILNIPNVITPNGDGINDAWNVKGLELYPGSKILIYDRYGKILVNKTFTNNPVWDGKYLGRPVPTTSYWYSVELTDGRKFGGWIVVRNYNEDMQ